MLNEEQRPGSNASVADWQAYAQSLLPDTGCAFWQNQHITALYAELYLRNPRLFKWAGMAAYASHHVRLALLPLRLSTGPTGCRNLDATRRRYEPLNSRDIELLRKTNAGIFADIYWAHLAYEAGPQGLEELSRLLGSESPMLRGFEAIEQGRALIEAGDVEAGNSLVWKGNLLLLRHEQESMVQPRFEELSTPFAHAVSAASTLHFSAGGPLERVRLFCSFYYYMATGGAWRRPRPPLLPIISHLPDRWSWIENCIVPRFRRFEDRKRSPIGRQLGQFISIAGRE